MMAGGVCVAQGECAAAAGTIVLPGTSGCHFDDGPADCCVPQDPKPGAATCPENGGVCTMVTGCLQAGGYYTSTDADCVQAAGVVCCVPHDRCGDQVIDCCTDMTVFLPNCDNGMFVCEFGEPKPKGTCMVP